MKSRVVVRAGAAALAVSLVAPRAPGQRTLAPSPPPAAAAESIEQSMPGEWVSPLRWRSIGPANMSGRIIDIDVVPGDTHTWYISTASGGLLKTTNNGTTFEHLFDDQNTVSIGAMAIAPSNPDVLYIGTGENNPRNSVSWGDGVYKSTDGGKSWEHVGLKETFQTGDVLVHPENPDVAWVGAMGRCWGRNPERGVYRTTDGGKTWKKVLYVDDATGCIDLAMHPENPDVLLAAMWERQRDEFDTNDPHKRWGPGSGLYRTTDGGESWKKVNEGLPRGANLGRMGLDWPNSEDDAVYVLVDSEKIGTGIENPAYAGFSGRDAEVGALLTSVNRDGPAAKAGLAEGDIIIRMDDQTVIAYDDLVAQMQTRQGGDSASLQVVRNGELLSIEITFDAHPEGDLTPFTRDLGGQAADIMHRQGPEGVNTGGLFKSTDAGETWTRINSINPRPMYFSKVRVDPSAPEHVYVLGIPLSKSSDGGETFSRDGAPGVHVDHHAMWINPADGRHMILGNDGGLYSTWDRGATWQHHNSFALGQFYHVTTDNQPLYMVYGGLQDNGSWGGPSRTRAGGGPDNTDWFRIGGGDGFVCFVDRDHPNVVYGSSQNGGMFRRDLDTGQWSRLSVRAPRGESYRFNWKTPYLLSHHNTKMWYAAGNHVFRSFDRGEGPKRISPEITRTGRGSATALSESPRDPEVLYVGSDDGSLWRTRDGGESWENIIFPREADPEPEAEEPAEEQRAAPEAPAEPAEEAREPQAPAQEAAEEGVEDAPRQPRAMRMFQRLDADGNGRLEGEEIPRRMRPFLGEADADGDGAISEAEFRAAIGRALGTPELPAEPGDVPPEPAEPGPEAADLPAAEQPETIDEQAAAPLLGRWEARLLGQLADQGRFELEFLLEQGTLVATVHSPMIDATSSSASFESESGRVRAVFETDFGRVVYAAALSQEQLRGTVELVGGEFSADFEATRVAPEAEAAEPKGPSLADLVDGPKRVASIEASRHADGRVYIALDGHYYDDDEPHVLVSEDYGDTWRSIRANLPIGNARVLREDLHNPDLLWLGTEFALWVSVDRGESWTKLDTLPTVAVHEVAQHPLSGDVVAATHGRSLWILDATPLRQLTARARRLPAHLIEPAPVVRWASDPPRGDAGGARWYQGQNGPDGAAIFYLLNEEAGDLSLRIEDAAGATMHTFDSPATSPGLHRLDWNTRLPPRGRSRFGQPVPAGVYRVVMDADGVRTIRPLRVVADPDRSSFEGFNTEQEILEAFDDEEENEAESAGL